MGGSQENTTNKTHVDENCTSMCLGRTVTEILIFSIGVIAIGVNLLIITVIYKTPKLHKKESAFIFSLAISDILQALVFLLQELGPRLFNYSHVVIWISLGLLYYLSYTTSILAICGFSIVKYIRIKYSFGFQRIVTKKAVKISIALIWLVPTSLYISFLLFHISCNLGGCRNTRNILESVVVIGIYLPCLVMAYVYCRLYFCTRQHIRNMSRLAPGCPTPNNNRAVRTIGALMLSFIVCWIPKVLLDHIMIVDYFPSYLVVLLTLTTVLGPVLNALVYIGMNNDFRNGLTSFIG